jgi:hypothetical protein
LRLKRNNLKLRYQVICALVGTAPAFTEAEVDLVREAFLSGARTLHCLVSSFKAGGSWIEATLEAESGFDLSKSIQVLKSVTARRLHAARGGPATIWAPGYGAATVGERLDVPEVVASLTHPSHPQESRA